jgi:pimeloyl-ACP methyl ester carboxylesterase
VLEYSSSDGAALAYRVAGPTGVPTLLFVHGWQADGRVWGALVERLSKRFRCIVVDLRGAGHSSLAPGPYQIARYAGDLSDAIEVLELDPLVLVGHSMGGTIAQRLAIDRPEAIEGLVLIATVPAGGMPLSENMLDMFRGTVTDDAKAARWLRALTVRELEPALSALLLAAARGVPPDVALESFDAWRSADFADEAATIETPTLILAPSADRPEFARKHVGDVIAGSRFEVLAECGHYAPLECPDAIAARIARFVDEL